MYEVPAGLKMVSMMTPTVMDIGLLVLAALAVLVWVLYLKAQRRKEERRDQMRRATEDAAEQHLDEEDWDYGAR